MWEERKKLLRQRESQLLLASFMVILASLSFVPYSEEVFALPLLLPVVLLTTMVLPKVRRGAAARRRRRCRCSIATPSRT